MKKGQASDGGSGNARGIPLIAKNAMSGAPAPEGSSLISQGGQATEPELVPGAADARVVTADTTLLR